MEKGFFDIFSKYDPAPEKRALLAGGHDVILSKYDKVLKQVEVHITFDKHEDPELDRKSVV